jgi:tight adherence protein C
MLEGLNALLTGLLGPLGPMIALGAVGLLLMVVTVLALPKAGRDPIERLRSEGRDRRDAGAGAGPALRQGSARTDKLDRFATFLEPQDEKEMDSARQRMLQAGYRSKSAVRTFHAVQFGLSLSLLFLGLVFALYKSLEGSVSATQLALYALVPGVLGYYAPKYWLERRRQSRQQEITEGFPDSLDLMLVCVEAGQSLDQSILRVAREMRSGYPALAEEFEIVSHEVKAGKERVSVLKDMGERCGVDDVRSFVTVLIQSATFGTSIADALRVYANEMRDKRVMRAEEKANVLPTKLTLGTMLLTVPPLMVILVGPSVYGIAQMLSGNSP